MKLQLDSSALDRLFPEGTEARVDLQQAVLQNIVNRNFIKMSDEKISAHVEQAVKAVELPDLNRKISDKLKSMLSNSGWGSISSSTQTLKDRVRLHAQEEATKVLRETISDATETSSARLTEYSKTLVADQERRIRKIVSEQLNQTVADVLNEKFEEFISEAIRKRLGV
ncbi:hypothetical protein PS2_076 [Serratia phage PS2]|uniref:Uncharacterized protein n=1 Tax=Serratia phage PS2 TaxID=1481112 RepID=A0A023W5J8_9CAUD|nr:hypothetical protein FF83_gp076 [Serratia phage PS2]AHY25323.1 hypothetical protein PS2_076 [Serratia phage PS2]